MATETKSPCACGAKIADGSLGSSVDPEIKHAIGTRLRRIEGQVRGLQRMIEEDTYCIDVLTQVSAATKALQSVAIGLLDEHVRHCVADASPENSEAMVTEAMQAIQRLVKS